MSMSLQFATVFVICATLLQATGSTATRAPQVLDSTTHLKAYEIYAIVLQRAWKNQTDTPLLQQETEPVQGCGGFFEEMTGAWGEVATDFRRQNAREQTLQSALPIDIHYRLIHRAEIQADDARLAQKYPGIWQRRPGSMEYWAVSMVGFNRDRTKAMVYWRSRMKGGIVRLELKDGRWIDALGNTCGWNA
jgi:hypothetical protein